MKGERLTMRMCVTSTMAICLICLLALTGCPRGNNAPMSDVIFDNSAYHTDGIFSDLHAGLYSANSFVLKQGASTISDIHWWGFYGFSNSLPPIDLFTIVFYEDDGGTPGSVIQKYFVGDVGRTDTGDTGGDINIYAYSVNISPLALTAGTTYWLSIYNDTDGFTLDYWLWSYSAGGSGSVGYTGDGSTWASFTETMAFTLTNDGGRRAQEAQLTQPTPFISRRPSPCTAEGGGSLYAPFARSTLKYGSNATVCL